jgi:hypothetical protein
MHETKSWSDFFEALYGNFATVFAHLAYQKSEFTRYETWDKWLTVFVSVMAAVSVVLVLLAWILGKKSHATKSGWTGVLRGPLLHWACLILAFATMCISIVLCIRAFAFVEIRNDEWKLFVKWGLVWKDLRRLECRAQEHLYALSRLDDQLTESLDDLYILPHLPAIEVPDAGEGEKGRSRRQIIESDRGTFAELNEDLHADRDTIAGLNNNSNEEEQRLIEKQPYLSGWKEKWNWRKRDPNRAFWSIALQSKTAAEVNTKYYDDEFRWWEKVNSWALLALAFTASLGFAAALLAMLRSPWHWVHIATNSIAWFTLLVAILVLVWPTAYNSSLNERLYEQWLRLLQRVNSLQMDESSDKSPKDWHRLSNIVAEMDEIELWEPARDSGTWEKATKAISDTKALKTPTEGWTTPSSHGR